MPAPWIRPWPSEADVDYSAIVSAADNEDDSARPNLRGAIQRAWMVGYKALTTGETWIQSIPHPPFTFLWDGRSPEPSETTIDSRMVGIIGQSAPQPPRRDSHRLHSLGGWTGRVDWFWGRQYDRGHFVAHSLGAEVSGLEMNIYFQRRDLNRGWSQEGKLFRRMEQAAVRQPGTLFWVRPVYLSDGYVPAFVEFGLLEVGDQVRVHRFDNQVDEFDVLELADRRLSFLPVKSRRARS